MTARFGTDGIRGVAGETPITPEVAVAVGRAASELASGGRVIVAADTRPSSSWLAGAVAAGAAAQGSEVAVAGVAPTSALAVALHRGLGAAGVMVTASHNPWRENGFKMFGAGGAKPDDALAAGLEAWIALPPPVSREPGRAVDAHGEVLAAWKSAMDAAVGDVSGLAGRKVAIDLANGAAIAAAGWLRSLPVDWAILGVGDGLPNDGVGSEHPAALGRRVRELGGVAGIAVDGDADRCVLVDADGTPVPGDAIAWLLARDRGVRAMAVTVMSTGALEPSLPGVRVVRTPVGDRFLREAMVREGLPLGAEDSGHVLFDDFPAGDGILTGIRALAAAFRSAGSVAEAVGGFHPYPRRLSKVRVSRRAPLETNERLAGLVLEGERDLGVGGRIFLRYSGTEPLLRILVEGAEADAVDRWSRRLGAAATEELS